MHGGYAQTVITAAAKYICGQPEFEIKGDSISLSLRGLSYYWKQMHMADSIEGIVGTGYSRERIIEV